MINKKKESIILILLGLIIICSSLYIYVFENTIFPATDSVRVKELNWLLSNFGKAGTAVLIAIPGIFLFYLGIRKFINKT